MRLKSFVLLLFLAAPLVAQVPPPPPSPTVPPGQQPGAPRTQRSLAASHEFSHALGQLQQLGCRDTVAGELPLAVGDPEVDRLGEARELSRQAAGASQDSVVAREGRFVVAGPKEGGGVLELGDHPFGVARILRDIRDGSGRLRGELLDAGPQLLARCRWIGLAYMRLAARRRCRRRC